MLLEQGRNKSLRQTFGGTQCAPKKGNHTKKGKNNRKGGKRHFLLMCKHRGIRDASLMANTAKKQTVKLAEKKNPEPENENEKLKAQIAELHAQIAELAKNAKKEERPVANRNIKFVNLVKGTAVLKGSQFWEIEGQYTSRIFPEKEARLIVANMGNFIASGAVYIDNAEFVADMDLDAIYATLLSDKDLKALLEHDASYVISTYKNVNEVQKGIIVDTIIDMRSHGKSVDNNVLVELGKLCGKNLLEIEPVEDTKGV